MVVLRCIGTPIITLNIDVVPAGGHTQLENSVSRFVPMLG